MTQRRGQFTERVVVNFLPAHRQAIQSRAQSLGMTESSFVRWLLMREVPLEEREPAALDN